MAANAPMVSTPVLGPGAQSGIPDETFVPPGKRALISPPACAAEALRISLRVGASAGSPPVRVSGGAATVVNAVLADRRLCPVLVASEAAHGAFSRSTVVTVDLLASLTNRTGVTVRWKQQHVPEREGLGSAVWCAPHELPPGACGQPLVWDDYMRLPAMEVGLPGMGWSRALTLTQGDHHLVVPALEEGGQPRCVRITVDQYGGGRLHVIFRSAAAASPARPPPAARERTPLSPHCAR